MTPLGLAFAFPVLLIVVIAVVEVGMWAYTRSVADAAAAEAANASATGGDGYQAGYTIVSQAGWWASAPSVSVSDNGVIVTATVSGHAHRLIPGNWTVSATATATAERTVSQRDRP